jgi:hypothetical protein
MIPALVLCCTLLGQSDRTAVDAYHRAAALIGQGEVSHGLRVLQDRLAQGGLDSTSEAYLRLHSAECLCYLMHHEEANQELDRAQALLQAEIDRGSRTAISFYVGILGLRFSICIDWGILDVAARLLQEEQRIINDLAMKGDDVTLQRASCRHRQATLALVEQDYNTLDQIVATTLEEDDLIEISPALRGRLLIRQAAAQNELERFEEAGADRARDLLLDLLDEYEAPEGTTSDLPIYELVHPKLMLAEIAIRYEEFEQADEWLKESRSLMEPELGCQAPFYMMWSTFAARSSLNRGAGREELQHHLDQLQVVLGEFLQRWQAAEVRQGGYGLLLFADHAAFLSELIRLQHHLQGSAGIEAALDCLWKIQSLSSLARALGRSQDASWRDLRDALTGDQAVLLFVPSAERTQLLVVTNAGPQYFELTGEAEIAHHRERVVRQMNRPASSEASRHEPFQTLSKLLFPDDVQTALESYPQWTVIGNDLLRDLPFEALPWRDGYIGTRIAIDHLPSLPVGVALHARPHPLQRDGADVWMLIPSHTEDMPPIDLPEDEVQHILRGFPRRLHQVKRGPGATLDTLSSPSFQKARQVLFFTHGKLDPSQEFPAALLLNPDSVSVDGTVRAATLGGLTFPPLVTMVACHAGAQQLRPGDAGATGLTGGFLKNGSQAVCLSSYPLELNAAKQVTASFQDALAEGHSPAESMRRARQSIAANPAFADPIYFSMQVQGLGHRPLYSRQLASGPPVLAWGSGVLLAVALGAVALRWIRKRDP